MNFKKIILYILVIISIFSFSFFASAKITNHKRDTENRLKFLNHIYFELDRTIHLLSSVEDWGHSIEITDSAINPYQQLLAHLNSMIVMSEQGLLYMRNEQNSSCLKDFSDSLTIVKHAIGSGVSLNNHDRAVSGNTVLIDYNFSDNYNPPVDNDHQSKCGDGISEGFTSELFCYASGDSGSALPNGKHIRNLVSISPDDSVNGYWVLFDEIDAVTAGKTIHIALHPPTADYSVITPGEEYEWNVNKVSGQNVFLSVFLGTAPSEIKIRDGAIGSWTNSFLSKYLYSTYITDSTNGKKNIVTILFPHNDTHKKADMRRISGDGYSGAEIRQNSIATIDYIIESSGEEVTYGGTTLCGLCALYRRVNNVNTFYFIRKGISFDDGNSKRKGFSAEAEVSVYMNGSNGSIVSPGTNVTFYYPGINGAKLDEMAAVIKTYGEGWMTVYVPYGMYELRLIKGSNHGRQKNSSIS